MAKVLDEKFCRRSIIEFLFRKGWGKNLREKATDEHGIDISVGHNKFNRRWLIEVKGDSKNKIKSPRSRQEVNFLISLGQIVTRMKIAKGAPDYKYTKKYGVGFPSTYEGLVSRRLPWAFCYRFNLYVFLVSPEAKVRVLDWRDLKRAQHSA